MTEVLLHRIIKGRGAWRVFKGACSLIFLKTLKVACATDAQQAPPTEFMSAQFGEVLLRPHGSASGFVFPLRKNGRHIGQVICLHPGCSAARYARLGSFLKRAEFHLLGELSFYQQQRNTHNTSGIEHFLRAKSCGRLMSIEEEARAD